MTLWEKAKEIDPVYMENMGYHMVCPCRFGFTDTCNDATGNCATCWNREYVEEKNDPIKPSYYNDSKITPFEVIDDWDLDFYLGNAIKYIKRAGKKKDNSRLQDLKKIREYVDQEIRKEELQNG